MHCPVCSNKDTKVVDTRLIRNGMSIRRRRECEKCEYRFSTGEEVELLDMIVIKRDGRRESYEREKIEKGLRQSLQKRPHTSEDFALIVRMVERDIGRRKTREIKSDAIGELIMKRLKSFDKVAYIRFASVYLGFDDINTFAETVMELQKSRHAKKNKK